MITAQLTTPIPAFGKTITQVAWRLSYPENQMYYQMQTVDGVSMKEGNWIVPSEIVQTWGEDDSVVSDALIAAQPWND